MPWQELCCMLLTATLKESLTSSIDLIKSVSFSAPTSAELSISALLYVVFRTLSCICSSAALKFSKALFMCSLNYIIPQAVIYACSWSVCHYQAKYRSLWI